MTSKNARVERLENFYRNKEVATGLDLPADIVQWTNTVRRLKGQPFGFDNRPYLPPVYRDTADEVYIVKGRQTEITEYAENWLFYNLDRHAGSVGLYMSDNQDRVSVFSKLRVHSWGIDQSPILQQLAADNKGNVSWQPWKNGSHLFMFSAWDDFDKALSIPADFVVIDEAQNQDLTALPKVKESMSHSKHKKIRVIGTGSYEGDSWHNLWMSGDQRTWDAKAKAWVAKKPENDRVAHSYHLSQEIVPWISAEEIEKKRNSPSYTPMRFLQEVIGWWWKGAKKPLTPQQVRALFVPTLSITPADKVRRSGHFPIFHGIDWGGGTKAYTIHWIWQAVDVDMPRFQVLYVARVTEKDTEKQADQAIHLIDTYEPDQVVMDAGGGPRQVQKLADRYGMRTLMNFYSERPGQPFEIDGEKNRVVSDRSWGIENVIDLVTRPGVDKLNRIMVPGAEGSNMDWIVDQFTAIEANTIQLPSGKSYIRYTHPEEQPDDALHACNYAYLAFLAWKQGAGSYDILPVTRR